MIENNELKIDDSSAVKPVDAGVQVGPDDPTSTTEKKRKKISRFYDWFWLVGLLIHLLNISICYEYIEVRYVRDLLTSGIIILATYTFTWMLSKRKRNVFTDFIWTLSYSIMVFGSGFWATKIMIGASDISCLIAFIYWALVWHCTRGRE